MVFYRLHKRVSQAEPRLVKLYHSPIAGQLNDGVISNDDLTSLSEDVQQAIEFIRR